MSDDYRTTYVVILNPRGCFESTLCGAGAKPLKVLPVLVSKHTQTVHLLQILYFLSLKAFFKIECKNQFKTELFYRLTKVL